MSVPFSEDLWQRLSALWRRDKKEVEEAVGYDDPQLKQMLDVMMVSRRSMKAAEKQKYDIDRAWRRVEKQTAGGWRVDRKSTRLNSSHSGENRMPSSA